MKHRRLDFWKLLLFLGGMGLLTLPLILYGSLHTLRPPRMTQTRSLFQGITYRRETRSVPRPLMIHRVEIDLTAPGLQVLVTPGKPSSDNTEIHARTTSEFVQEFGVQLGINASFFFPFREQVPWDYYPHSGDRVNTVGQSISNREIYSLPEADWPVLCFGPNNQAQILAHGECPQGTAHAVAGSHMLVEQGKFALDGSSTENDKAYARTAIATNRSGDKLWLVIVDAKQPFYSEGLLLSELAELFLALGADTAINLDGGGSTTLIANTPNGPQALNAPIHTKLPMRERPIANHLGFYALPK